MSDPAAETAPDRDTDILIIGAGPVGVTLALALANSPWRVRLVDRQPAGAWQKDPRALALSHGSRQLLERLDAWNANAATPIERIHISQRGGFGRTRLTADDHGLPALGYVMRYRDLLAALHARLNAALLTTPCLVKDIAPTEGGIGVTLESGSTRQHLSAKLVVHAEGTPADEPGIRVRDYGQHAIVCEVTPEAWLSHFQVVDKVSVRQNSIKRRATAEVAHGTPGARLKTPALTPVGDTVAVDVPANEVRSVRIFATLPPNAVSAPNLPAAFVVQAPKGEQARAKTTFLSGAANAQ